jgi:DDE superfamily endonuclease
MGRATAFIFLGWTERVPAEEFPRRALRSLSPDHHLLVVLDGAPSHRSEEIELPENVSFLRLPAYSLELNPVERWFLEFRKGLSNRIFESVELLQAAISYTLEPYWQEPARLRRLVGYSWWLKAVSTLAHQCA